MVEIIILNGVAKKNGNTAKLVDAFKEGVDSSHTITEFYIQSMDIKGCLDCQSCIGNDSENPCVQRDDMVKIYEKFSEADIVVFASPMYWGTISGILKTVVDRLYPFCNPYSPPPYKESIFLMTANSTYYKLALDWYGIFEMMGWKNRGVALGVDKIKEAKKLGSDIE